MGIPKYVLTDNMKSVVLHRDFEGHPVWQKDYETFMKTVGFQTKLCKPRHPFTKGKVERLVRFVKENFLVGRIFWNITDLNRAALNWCNQQNSTYHKATAGVPQELHYSRCAEQLQILEMNPACEQCLPVFNTILSYLDHCRCTVFLLLLMPGIFLGLCLFCGTNQFLLKL